MKLRHFIILFLVMNFSLFLAAYEIQQKGDVYQLQLERQAEEKAFIFAFPSESAAVEIVTAKADEYNSEGQFVKTVDTDVLEFISYQESFIMRELHGHTFVVYPTLKMNNRSYRLQDLQFRIIPEDDIAPPNQISSVFLPLYQSMVSNYETSYLRDLATTAPRMLVLTQPPLANSMTDFLLWKKQLGIETDLFTTNDAGTTNTQIKEFIQERYDNEATRPDYLLIIGDVDDTFVFPSFYYGSENNVSDQPYALLSGNDYFPDVLTGRFSVDTSFELMTIIAKQFRYARNPYIEYGDWFEKAVLVAGNYASSPPIPTTPKDITIWMGEKMLDYGFQSISEIYYPPTYPGTSQITSAINSGASFVTYRGWGDANGWHYPYYHTENIADLNNGAMLPVMTSIVCNTGDFANNVDPCFGEAMLRTGTPSSPKGMVAFVGPSDLHTSTKYNNNIYSGFYTGLLDEDIYDLGTAMLRGKIELYQNFPLEREVGGQVEFYFHVYNILGDPSLQMWTKTPESFTASLPEQMSIASNHLEVTLNSDLNGAIASALQNDNLLDASTVQNGSATLYFDELENEDVLVTISKPNFVPVEHTIEVVTSNVDIGISEITAETLIVAGQNNIIDVTLHNYGTENSEHISALLGSSNSMISFVQNSVDYGVIGAGASITREVHIMIDAACPDQEVFEISMEILPFNQTRKFELIAGSLQFDIVNFEVTNNDGFLEPGTESTIEVTIMNSSIIHALNTTSTVISLSDAANVISNSISIGDVSIGETVSFAFDVHVAEDVYVGRPISFELDFSAGDGYQQQLIFTMEAGEVTPTAPTGPDGFGYYAYDNFDTDYSEVPTYFWHEIDPQEGGNGEVLLMGDDESQTISLPFPFKYYGEESDEITICSNGWIAFEPTWMHQFINWTIPSAWVPNKLVAPFWDDLIGAQMNDSEFEDMRICYYHDTSENYFVIEWNEAYNRRDYVSLEKFQIILYDPAYHAASDGNGVIQFNYHTVSNIDYVNNYCTVGINNLGAPDGLTYTYASLYPPSATPLQDGLAIKFTTDSPDTYTFADENTVPNPQAKLYPNYPNPFNPTTNISFEIPAEGNVSLKIYDVKGRLVKTLMDKPVSSGFHSIVWDGDDDRNQAVGSGIYFYQLSYGKETAKIQKCVLIK